MTANPLASLMKNLATTATAYAAVIDDVLDVRTLTETKKGVAQNTLAHFGVPIPVIALVTCQNSDCDCAIRMMQDMADQIGKTVEIVSVKIEVSA